MAEHFEKLIPPDVPQTGPVTVENLRAALAYLEPNDPALQAMIDGTAPVDLAFVEQVVENTLPTWRVVLKDRRLGLWTALVHFFETVEREEGGEDGDEMSHERLGRLGGLMLRILEAEWTRLHPFEGRRDADLLEREGKLLSLLSAVLDRLVQVGSSRLLLFRASRVRNSRPQLTPLFSFLKLVDSALAYQPTLIVDSWEQQCDMLIASLLDAMNHDTPERADAATCTVRKILDTFSSLDSSDSTDHLSTFLSNLVTGAVDIGRKEMAGSDRSSRLCANVISAVKSLNDPALLSFVIESTTEPFSTFLSLLPPPVRQRIELLVTTATDEEFSSKRSESEYLPRLQRALAWIWSFFDTQSSLSLKYAGAPIEGNRSSTPSSPGSSPPVDRISPSSLSSYNFGASITSYPSPTSLKPPLPPFVEVDRLPHSQWILSGLGSSALRRFDYTEMDGTVRPVLIKYAAGTTLEEADVMKFVAAKTSIRMPQAMAVDQFSWWSTIFNQVELTIMLYMPFLPGERLDTVDDGLDTAAQAVLRENLSHVIGELRSLRPTPGFVGGFVDPYCQAVANATGLDLSSIARPFRSASLAAFFTECLSLATSSSHGQGSDRPLPAWFSSSPLPPLRFAHGDLAGRNILVDPETGRLEGLIDYEHSGWWPAGMDEVIAAVEVDREVALLGEATPCSQFIMQSLRDRP
ncbi:hypothetical protein JCM11251_002100 [Rhodosporidiobolus azoricus]